MGVALFVQGEGEFGKHAGLQVQYMTTQLRAGNTIAEENTSGSLIKILLKSPIFKTLFHFFFI